MGLLQLPSDSARKPVALLLEGIGDNILMLPAIRALARSFDGRLALIGHADAFDLFFNDIPLRSKIGIDRFWKENGELAYDVSAVSECVGECDIFLSFNRSLSKATKELTQALRPRVSIGFFEGFDIHVPFTRGIHAVDLAFKLPLIFRADLVPESFIGKLPLPPAALQVVSDLRSAIPSEAKILAVHVETSPAKSWPRSLLATALRAFLSKYNHFAAITIERETLSADQAITGVASFAGLPLPVSLALAVKADAFIGVDSCMLHAADLSGVPGVALFGPTAPTEFGYRFAGGVNISGGAGISAITPNLVYSALERLVLRNT